jgi:hypothetical protein
MSRTILLHVNADVPDSDPRSAEQIADAVRGALDVGSDDDMLAGVGLEIVLAEEV